MSKEQLDFITDLITAISKLLWPVFAFVVLIIYRAELRTILKRFKKGTFFGQELELSDEIEKLKSATEKAENEVLEADLPSDEEKEHMDISRLTENPKAGIVLLSAEIEKQVRLIIASLGMLDGKNHLNVHNGFNFLQSKDLLPKNVASSIRIFWDLRNKIVHGKDVSEDREVIKILDIGLTLLRLLKAIPHEINIVFHPGVTIFTDPDCKNPMKGVLGLILQTQSAGGINKYKRIFPTTRIYESGMIVSWEWNLSSVWNEAWYIDPETLEKKYAWSQSGEFIGRDIRRIL